MHFSRLCSSCIFCKNQNGWYILSLQMFFRPLPTSYFRRLLRKKAHYKTLNTLHFLLPLFPVFISHSHGEFLRLHANSLYSERSPSSVFTYLYFFSCPTVGMHHHLIIAFLLLISHYSCWLLYEQYHSWSVGLFIHLSSYMSRLFLFSSCMSGEMKRN